MSWAKIDDQSAFHMKVLFVGNAAWGALCRMVAHSCAGLTDGFVATETAHLIATPEEMARLMATPPGGKSPMLKPADRGYTIHDFHVCNPFAADEIARREKDQKRKKKGQKKQGRGTDGRIQTARSSDGNPNGIRTESERNPTDGSGENGESKAHAAGAPPPKAPVAHPDGAGTETTIDGNRRVADKVPLGHPGGFRADSERIPCGTPPVPSPSPSLTQISPPTPETFGDGDDSADDDRPPPRESVVTKRARPSADVGSGEADPPADAPEAPAATARPAIPPPPATPEPFAREDGVTELGTSAPAGTAPRTPIPFNDRRRSGEWGYAKSAYADVIGEVRGHRYVIPDRAHWEFLDAIAAHCPHVRVEDVVPWVSRTVSIFGYGVKGDERAVSFRNAYDPAQWVVFLNNGGAIETLRSEPTYDRIDDGPPAMSDADRNAAADALLAALDAMAVRDAS